MHCENTFPENPIEPKNTFVFILLACSLFGQADHLLLSTIVIAPDSAEMVIIKNPTDSEISLNNYLQLCYNRNFIKEE